VLARWSTAVERAARRGVRGHASLKAADGDHLVPRPESNGEEAGAMAQNQVGALIEQLKGWNQATPNGHRQGGRRAARLVARWAGWCWNCA
jgi:hypothetical protein